MGIIGKETKLISKQHYSFHRGITIVRFVQDISSRVDSQKLYIICR